MSVASFIPNVWAAQLLMELEKSLVYAQPGVVNRNYEGLITGLGDTVTINSIADIEINDYVPGTKMGNPQRLQLAGQKLQIDQSKSYSFSDDDVDRLQAAGDMRTEAMRRAAWGLRDHADRYVAGLMAAAIPSGNAIAAVGSPKTDLGTAGKAYEYLTKLGVKLDENDVPSEGRWCIVPPWFHGTLLQDVRFVGSGSAQAETRITNGMIGQAAGFTVLISNNVPKTSPTTAFRIIAGSDIATSYAEQLVKTEAFRSPDEFADIVRGLHLYGAKVLRPKSLAVLFANPPAE